jgi:glycerol kinase
MRAHVVRATLEAIAFQIADVLDALPGDLRSLRADGGATANSFLMQFQADLLGCPVEVAAERDTTAVGAAALAALGSGLWGGVEELTARLRAGRTYEPTLGRAAAEELRAAWRRALARARL